MRYRHALFSLLGVVQCKPAVDFQGGNVAVAGGIQNIEIAYREPVNGELSLCYGDCDSVEIHHCVGRTYVGNHTLAARHALHHANRPARFVWVVPEDVPSGGCMRAAINGLHVGSSLPFTVQSRKKRRRWVLGDIGDALGPWFDGVEYLRAKEPADTFVAQAKSKSVTIVGAGMAGLMTALLLDSVGLKNWTILESSHRLGGRVRTSYLNGTRPDQYQYQELGPMRFPVSQTDPTTNKTVPILDHQLVFQLVDYLNKMNGNDSALAVKLIPWIQDNINAPIGTSHRLPDGTEPSGADAILDPNLLDNSTALYSNLTAVQAARKAYSEFYGRGNLLATVQANVFKAHRQAVDAGQFDFSEVGYLRYVLRLSANLTDEIVGIGSDFGTYAYEVPIASFSFDDVYFMATEWNTIDKGLSQLPNAFAPLVSGRTLFGARVESMDWNNATEKVTFSWRDTPFSSKTSSLSSDYAVVTAPFTRVRVWRLPRLSSLLSRSIANLKYSGACKVALHFKTRFWEKFRRPILGGCGSTNIAGIGSICYPPYNLNGSGPGVLLAQYNEGAITTSFLSMSEEEHIAYVLRAIVDVHGAVAAEQYTGNYDRVCWETETHHGGAWADPLVGQQETYMPAYFRTELNTVFVGEHTSQTHAWVFSALESAVRGTTQLLLEMGLVDEAKRVVELWMARWISV